MPESAMSPCVAVVPSEAEERLGRTGEKDCALSCLPRWRACCCTGRAGEFDEPPKPWSGFDDAVERLGLPLPGEREVQRAGAAYMIVKRVDASDCSQRQPRAAVCGRTSALTVRVR